MPAIFSTARQPMATSRIGIRRKSRRRFMRRDR
jgi:hypothetical protein